MNKKTEEIVKIKAPDLRFPVMDVFAKRFSPRFFSDEKIKEEDISSMIEAARWTPSARNIQPWYFYWMHKGSESFDKLGSCIPDKHHWAHGAALYILSCYIDDSNQYALYDLGQSVITLVIQAQSLGYYARQVGNFDREKAKQILNIPDPQRPFVIIAMGKPGDYTKAPPEIITMDSQKRERKTNLARELK